MSALFALFDVLPDLLSDPSISDDALHDALIRNVVVGRVEEYDALGAAAAAERGARPASLRGERHGAARDAADGGSPAA